MRTTKLNIIVVSVVFLNFSIYSQNNEGQSNTSGQLIKQYINVIDTDLDIKKLEGSVYINKDFLPAKLSNNNTIYSANYNAYQDEMVIKMDGGHFVVSKDHENTVTFVNTNKIYKTFNYEDDGNMKKGFFVLLESGQKMSLLKRERIKFHEEVKPKMGHESYQAPKLKRENDQLYIGYSDHTAIVLPKKKKDIFDLFTGKAKEIETYAKQQKLNVKKEEDLLQLVNYYNSLD